MLTSKKLSLGQPGTKRLVNQYGARLMCVRYRYDPIQGKRFKTIELILEESSWQPPVRPFQDDEPVLIRIEFSETYWRDRVKSAGGKWNSNLKLWEIKYGQVRKLGLTDRIHSPNVSDNGKPDEPSVQSKVSDNGKSKTSVRGE
jgi:hypothetical protein